jgi:hypothetical protein
MVAAPRSPAPMAPASRSPTPMAPAAASRPVPIQGQRQVPYPAIELGREMPLSPADAYAAKVAREVERQKKEALQGTRRTTV